MPGNNILALIPARGGSKRAKNKNIKLLGGKPLLSYTINAACKSKLINRIVVTTDNLNIARVAKQYKAEVPFMRPAKLASDTATEYQFHLHAIKWLKKHESYEPDLIVNLYPTSPFRNWKSIDKAIQLMQKHPQVDSLRSIRKVTEHPYKMWRKKNKLLVPFVKTKSKNIHTFSYQLLPKAYIQNASIYITRPRTLYKYQSTVGHRVLAFEMDDFESIDINSEIDFMLSETLLKVKKLKKS